MWAVLGIDGLQKKGKLIFKWYIFIWQISNALYLYNISLFKNFVSAESWDFSTKMNTCLLDTYVLILITIILQTTPSIHERINSYNPC